MMKLKKQIASANPKDKDAAKNIYEYIKENISPHVTEDNGTSHSMLIYLARRITEPDLNCDEIPQLLEILANIEAIRRRTVDQARRALCLQESFESQRPGAKLMKKQEVKKLQSIADDENDKTIRLVLRADIVLALYRLHICYLWTSPKFYLILKFMRRYFPGNYVEEGDPFADEHWQDVLNHDLTIKERKVVYAFGEEMKQFMTEAHTWDLERKTYFENFGHSEEEIFGDSKFMSYTRDFNARFRDTKVEKRMLESLKVYLTEVESILNYFEKLFPSAQQKAERAAATLLAREEEMQKSNI